ncbi:MAG: twin-arginine translocation signal domain-containing protein [Lysobacterales bacterium]
MTPKLDKALRHGGMSRRGFLRAMGVTAAAVLVPGMGPGLAVPRFGNVPITATRGVRSFKVIFCTCLEVDLLTLEKQLESADRRIRACCQNWRATYEQRQD